MRKLTKSSVEALPYPVSGQAFYRDSELRGFGLRVGTATKTYIAEAKVNGRVVRCTIGKHGVFTAEQARQEARDLLRLMAKGINPNDEKAQKKAKCMTLADAFHDFVEARKSLKPRTLYDYRRLLNVCLADWVKKPLTEITKDMVARRHRKLGEISQAQANLTMRFLRALFNFAMGQYEDSKGHALITENPVKRLSQTRAWYRIERRQSVIKPYELKPWFEAVMRLKNDHTSDKRDAVRDYLLLLLLTGLRRQEAASLRVENVDLKARTLTVLDTKNRDPHTLPLSDYVHALLERRIAETVGDYIFSGEGRGGYLVEPRKQMTHVIRESGVSFTLHDLRRTFITVAEGLDIPAYALKRLLNHRIANDVTAGYIVTDVERLREPMQKITDYILKAVGVKQSAPILRLKQPA